MKEESRQFVDDKKAHFRKFIEEGVEKIPVPIIRPTLVGSVSEYMGMREEEGNKHKQYRRKHTQMPTETSLGVLIELQSANLCVWASISRISMISLPIVLSRTQGRANLFLLAYTKHNADG